MNTKYLARMIDSYLNTAGWLDVNDQVEGAREGRLNRRWSKDAILDAVEDCRDFYRFNARFLVGKMEPEQAGYDFWLTRCRHGAGFWDRGLGKVGDHLTRAAHVYGEAWCYLGDDGLVYFA